MVAMTAITMAHVLIRMEASFVSATTHLLVMAETAQVSDNKGHQIFFLISPAVAGPYLKPATNGA